MLCLASSVSCCFLFALPWQQRASVTEKPANLKHDPLWMIKLTFVCSFFSGWVSPLHRGPTAPCQVFCLHLVQPPSSQTKILQKAREKNVTGRRKEMQRWTDGKEREICWIVILLLIVCSTIFYGNKDSLNVVKQDGTQSSQCLLSSL